MNEMQKDFGKKPKIAKEYTLEEFLDFVKDKDERCELINGRIYMMAAPAINHQRIVRFISTRLSNYLEGKTCEPFISPTDVVLFEKGDRSKYKNKSRHDLQPDVFVICDPKKIGEKRIYGAPDFVVEVVSPSSETHDYFEKLQAYLEYGVKEYWIVNPESKEIVVYINIKGKREYKRYNFDDKIKASIFGDFYIDFKELQI